MIDARVQRQAIALVRGAIAEHLGGPPPELPGHPFFAEIRPAFVTLHRVGVEPEADAEPELHGCIGSFARLPLVETLPRSAVSAAFEDPRATPLSFRDLDDLDLEISMLSSATPIAFSSEEEARDALRPAIDGVILRYHPHHGTARHGLFLPQVWQSLPDPKDFLDELKRKAGLPRTFWAPEITLERFTVEVIHDEAPRVRLRRIARHS
ncbi:MAG: AmmeMemoRadiSam system protein A [Sandaracinaceae bacterium]|nr:AmmeMemoRadiSam system protein A [Sandaracinaceae bacterium]